MNKYWWVVGLGLALLVAFLSPLASSHPDGLERVAEDKGFIEKAREPWYEVIPDYVFPGLSSERAATIVAGLVGTLVVFLLVMGMSRAITKRGGSAS